jgi:DNA-directed RNA polymerase subunit K/omega
MSFTRFEKTRLISARALQLALGAPALVKQEKNDSMIDLARKELDKQLLPLSVIRVFPNKEIQRIEVN